MKKNKEKVHKYIFPNFLAVAMKNVDMKTQLESAMMSMFLLLMGMILMSVYTAIYLTYGLVFKSLLLFNLVAGFLFMTSYLVTTYQQYNSYMVAVEVQKIMDKTPIIPRKKNRFNQFLFFVGLLLIIGSIVSYYLLKDNVYRYYIVGSIGLIGFIMILAVFLRKPKSKLKNNQQKIDDNLSVSYDEIQQNKQLQQEEGGISELIKQEIRSEKSLDELDQEVLRRLEEESRIEPETEYIDYSKNTIIDKTKKKYKGDIIFYK